jgi:hypothetical protein
VSDDSGAWILSELLLVHGRQPLHRFGYLNEAIPEKIRSFVQRGGISVIRKCGEVLCDNIAIMAYGDVSTGQSRPDTMMLTRYIGP